MSSFSVVEYKNRKMVLSVYRDITECKNAEQAIGTSEKRFRIFFENNLIPMWVLDLESYRFLEMNNAAINHYGYSKEEFLAMNIMKLHPVVDIDNLQEALQIIKTKESNTIFLCYANFYSF